MKTELFKQILAAAHPIAALAVMSEAGLLLAVLGGVSLLASLSNMIKSEAALALPPDPVRRLGALALFTLEDADRLRDRLRLANAEHERLHSMADGWWRIASATAEQDGHAAALYRLGRTRFVDRRAARLDPFARRASADCDWHDLARLPERWAAPDFPLKAADLMQRGVDKGPALGAALRAAEEVWIAADFPTEEADVATIADTAAKRAYSG